MCNKCKPNDRKIDKCMINLCKACEYIVVGSCCGHGKYPPTIVVKSKSSDVHYEIVSGTIIQRKRRFYRRDEQGYYYIPEVIEKTQKVK